MLIVAIGWLYVVVMIAAASESLLIAIVRLLFLGVLPVGLLLWIKLRQHRARMSALQEAEAAAALESESSSPTDGARDAVGEPPRVK